MQIRTTAAFDQWLRKLRDDMARAIIARRLRRLADGNPGNTRSVGSSIVELKIDFGPGYRVYYVQRGNELVILLCGGDKGTQDSDIRRAKILAAQVEQEPK